VLLSIPVAYTVHKKETYENRKEILSCLNYQTYQWHICGDLKVTAILMGLHKGYIKFSYFLCKWDSRAKSVHYSKKNWHLRKSHTPGTKNAAHQPLVDPCKVLLAPLHIKLGLMKKFRKGIRQKSASILILV
jgi:hypothetical protein